ncbi:hypothetical protein FS749_001141 [Ceratobasidium sp. UAMH 11750]|nr:hypothetical protein FS749_001141 [Ceratobasidium sp. UAMH 11750]
MATRTRHLDVDLKGLEGAVSGFVLDVNGEANGSASKEPEKFADDSVDEGSRRHGLRTGSLDAEHPTEDSLELNLDMDTGSRLLDIGFNSLDDALPDADLSKDDHRLGLDFNTPTHTAPPTSFLTSRGCKNLLHLLLVHILPGYTLRTDKSRLDYEDLLNVCN